jgi:flagellar FliL protein
MAEKKAETAAQEEGGGAKGRGKRKLLIIVGAVTLLLAGGGGAAAYFMLGKKNGEIAETKAPPRKMPVFVELEVFTVNLPTDDADRFMQVRLVAEMRDSAASEMLKTLMPSVRNEILLLLGSKKADDVATREGKEKLAQEIVLAANKPLDGTPAAKGVEHVNFTHLIVQ